MNAKQIDATLDAKTIQQLTWKPALTCNIGITIVRHFVRDHIAYNDAVALDYVPDDSKNCIGLAWRRIVAAGIIKPTGRYKRSKADSRRGGKVYQYRLASLKLAETFLKRNGWKLGLVKAENMELFDTMKTPAGGKLALQELPLNQ